MALEEYTDEELRRELRERKEKSIKEGLPLKLENFDFSPLADECEEYLLYIATYRSDSDQRENNIYELAMETIYGEKVWDWIKEIWD